MIVIGVGVCYTWKGVIIVQEISFAELALMEKAETACLAGQPLFYSDLDPREQALYRALKEKGLMARVFEGSSIRLTPLGTSSLEIAGDRRRDAEAAARLERKSIHRSWWQVAVTALLAALCTELIGLLAKKIIL